MASASLLSMFSSQKLAFVNAKLNVPDLLVLKELAEAKKLTPSIDRSYRLEDAVQALKELEKGHARGKSAVVTS
jgi:D-arabinose 1-dehydrogenase-like Zn-dependent alcohol dehydrogenase